MLLQNKTIVKEELLERLYLLKEEDISNRVTVMENHIETMKKNRILVLCVIEYYWSTTGRYSSFARAS